MAGSSSNQFLRPTYQLIGTDRFLSWNSYEALKGILIFFIVLGHNTVITDAEITIFYVLYNFHVASFLLIPFLLRPDAFRWPVLADKLVRYLVPYLLFVLVFSPLWYYTNRDSAVFTSEGYDWATHLFRSLYALVLGTSSMLKSVTGFNLLWFLPVLAVLTVIRSWYYSLPPARANLAFALIVTLFLYVDIANPKFVSWYLTPLIAAYMFPLGILATNLVEACSRVRNQAVLTVAAVALLVVLETISYRLDVRVGLSKLLVGSFDEPVSVLLLPFLMLTGFIACLLVSRYLGGVAILRTLGKYSLVIYLAHSPIFQFLLTIAGLADLQPEGFIWGSVLLVLTLTLSLAAAVVIDRVTLLRNLVTPRDRTSFKSVFARA